MVLDWDKFIDERNKKLDEKLESSKTLFFNCCIECQKCNDKNNWEKKYCKKYCIIYKKSEDKYLEYRCKEYLKDLASDDYTNFAKLFKIQKEIEASKIKEKRTHNLKQKARRKITFRKKKIRGNNQKGINQYSKK